ncbi:MAG: hypothetical protein H7301_12445 [Cryobacterium sp.]|nr:hypothetical protein [Oligoflexia bacterium]
MIKDYISGLSKFGELSAWSVAVMSSKSGTLLDLGNGRSTFMVDRSFVKMAKSEVDPTAKHLKTVTAPRDEMIDLDDLLAHLNARNTDDLFEKTPGLSDVSYRLKTRPKERGLVLLYPINPNIELTEADHMALSSEPSQTVILKAVAPVIGVAFVFPETQNSKSKYKYLVNKTI